MKERLSALMDDQGDPSECDRCLEGMKVDIELRRTWAVYHLIGDVLRGTDAPALPESFAERLANEPTIVAPQRRHGADTGRTPTRYIWPVAAAIAAVAFVAWVSLPQLQPAPVLQAQTTTVAPMAAAPVVPVAQDVGDYLLAHQRFSPSSAMSGVAPYVRTVSESGPAR
jgi:sigma-E factor negative regulatory protein RseA